MKLSDDCKKKCQIFTPKNNVKELLDWVGYSENLYGKKIIEPSCGQGNILVDVVERYILDSLKNNYSRKEIKKGLSQDIYGIEYDKKHYDKCIDNINSIIKKYGIDKVDWNIYCTDSLKLDLNIKFDYVVGNPPYISYKMLDEETRNYVRKNFDTCSQGKFDYCYPFIEKGVEFLKNGGKIAFLVPGSIFKNVFSGNLREFLKRDIIAIYDYATRKLFNEYATGEKKKILTSSIIFVLQKGSNSGVLNYYNLDSNKNNKISKNNLGTKWIFNETSSGENRFGDYFKVSNSIATLYNKAYIIKENDILFQNEFENMIIKDAVSPKSIELKIKEKIIFPYFYDSIGNLVKINKEKFSQDFPNVERHLKKYTNELKNRKSDKNIQWFEYGRSQALNDMNKPKLLLSIIVTGKVKAYILSKEIIPYSGIYIIPKRNMTLDMAKRILESDNFLDYIKSVGINASGDSYRITSKDISNYYF